MASERCCRFAGERLWRGQEDALETRLGSKPLKRVPRRQRRRWLVQLPDKQAIRTADDNMSYDLTKASWYTLTIYHRILFDFLKV